MQWTLHLRKLDRLHMSNTQGKWVFTIHVKREINPEVATALRDPTMHETLELYRIQRTNFFPDYELEVTGSLAEEISRRLDPDGLRLLADDLFETHLVKKDAMAHANLHIHSEDAPDGDVVPLERVEGVLAGMVRDDRVVLMLVTICQYTVIGRRRRNMDRLGYDVRLRNNTNQH